MKFIVINFLILLLTIIFSIMAKMSNPANFFSHITEGLGTYDGEAISFGIIGFVIYITIFFEEYYIIKHEIKFSFWRSILIWVIAIIIFMPIPLYIAGGGSVVAILIPVSLIVLIPYFILRKIFDNFFKKMYSIIGKYYVLFFIFLLYIIAKIFSYHYSWWVLNYL